MSRVTLGLALHSQGGTLKTHATKLERRKRDRENRNRKSAKQSRSPSALAARAVGVATLTRQFFALGIPRHLPFRTIFDLERLDPAPAPGHSTHRSISPALARRADARARGDKSEKGAKGSSSWAMRDSYTRKDLARIAIAFASATRGAVRHESVVR